MNTDKASEFFDSYYFAHGCGRPYQRDDEWLSFFDSIAARIVQDLQPETVLDAGCAMGFLVEGLRNRHIQAYGIDISEYAIANTHESIKSYCWVGSITNPFPQRYDLIVSIEVLEHMSKEDAELAIANLCKHTDNILFSSTPFDYKEVTHLNVQPPEYWAEHFARYGFYRNVDFDASIITPWTVLFQKSTEPIHLILRRYERRFWLLWKETQDLRALATEMREDLAKNDQDLQAKTKQIQSLTTEVNSLSAQLMEWNDHWANIHSSKTWRILQTVSRLRSRMTLK